MKKNIILMVLCMFFLILGSCDNEPGHIPTIYNLGLKSLNPSDGTLNPIFDIAITNYDLSLPNDIEKISFTAEALEGYNTLTFDPPEAEYGKNGVSLTEDKPVIISIKVTAPDNTIKTYTIIVVRNSIVTDEFGVINILLRPTMMRGIEGIRTPDGYATHKLYDSITHYTAIFLKMGYFIEGDPDVPFWEWEYVPDEYFYASVDSTENSLSMLLPFGEYYITLLAGYKDSLFDDNDNNRYVLVAEGNPYVMIKLENSSVTSIMIPMYYRGVTYTYYEFSYERGYYWSDSIIFDTIKSLNYLPWDIGAVIYGIFGWNENVHFIELIETGEQFPLVNGSFTPGTPVHLLLFVTHT